MGTGFREWEKGKAMRIDVTREHIERGEKNIPLLCPVALAVRDATGEVVSVSSRHLRFQRLNNRTVELPDFVQLFILRFDRGLVMQPISFDLDMDWGMVPARVER